MKRKGYRHPPKSVEVGFGYDLDNSPQLSLLGKVALCRYIFVTLDECPA
jgi:hypothetical protein